MEPKLLTVSDLDRLCLSMGQEALLRERGLIAPEPVDPNTVTLCDAMNSAIDRGWLFTQDEAERLREELRSRGMELAQPKELTRVMVRDAILRVIGEGEHDFRRLTPNNITALHAALTDAKPCPRPMPARSAKRVLPLRA